MDKDITKLNWYYWPKRNRSPFFLYYMYHGPTIHTLKEIDFNIKRNGSCDGQILTEKHELKEFGDNLWKVIKDNPDYLLSVYRKAYQKYKRDVKKWRKLLRKNFRNLCDEELLKEYNTYLGSILDYSKYVYIPISVETQLQEEGTKIIDTNFGAEKEKAIQVIMTPVKESVAIEERKSLLQIATRFGKVAKKRKILGHLENYSFLKEKGFFIEFFDEKHYIEEISNIPNPKEELFQLEQQAKTKQNEMKNLLHSLSKENRVKIKTINESIFFRTWRFSAVTQSSYYAKGIFYELSNRMDLEKKEDSIYLFPDEVGQYFNKEKINLRNIIAERKKGIVYITFGKDDALLLQGDKAKDLFEKMKKDLPLSNEIHGVAAFQGHIIGKATVLKETGELRKISGAEILVVHSTSPEMVVFFKKIKAIVAEEGGILSHPSLISREMKIPCVVGAENATKIIKDGDLVEVDANIGKVKILERKK